MRLPRFASFAALAAAAAFAAGVAVAQPVSYIGSSGQVVKVTPDTPLPTTSSGGGGAGDVNITEVGGNAVSSTVPVSGTVTVTDGAGALNVIVDSSALPSGAATSAKQPALGTAGSAATDVITVQGIASGTALSVSAAGDVAAGSADSGNPVKVGGKFNSSRPTLTNGQRGDLQLDARGSLAVNLYGGTNLATVTTATNISSTGNPGLETFGIGYLTNSGNTAFKAVPNAYDGMDLAGDNGLAVDALAGQCDDTTPVTVTENQFGNIRLNCTDHSLVVGGGVASGAADSGKPVKVGGVYNSSRPTFTTGQRGDLQVDTRGNLAVSIWGSSSQVDVSPMGTSITPSAKTGLIVYAPAWNYTSTGSATNPVINAYNGMNFTGDSGLWASALAAQCDDTSPTALTENNWGNVRLNCTDHSLYVNNPDGATFSGSVSSATTIATQDMNGYNGFNFLFSSIGSGNFFTVEASPDNSTWFTNNTCTNTATAYYNQTVLGSGNSPSTSSLYMCQKIARYGRVRVSTYSSGTVTLAGQLLKDFSPTIQPVTLAQNTNSYGSIQGCQTESGGYGNCNPVGIAVKARNSNPGTVTSNGYVGPLATIIGAQITKPYSIPEADWTYAAATGGISNTTTAVTMVAAAGSGIRNYVTGCQITDDTLGTATEVAIRDGAGGTVLWRAKLGTAAAVLNQTFATPLKGTANTLMEVVTLTATTTGGVFVNCQGYQAP